MADANRSARAPRRVHDPHHLVPMRRERFLGINRLARFQRGNDEFTTEIVVRGQNAEVNVLGLDEATPIRLGALRAELGTAFFRKSTIQIARGDQFQARVLLTMRQMRALRELPQPTTAIRCFFIAVLSYCLPENWPATSTPAPLPPGSTLCNNPGNCHAYRPV